MKKAIALLMVNDDPIDIQMSRDHFKEYKVANHCLVVNDDLEALRFLRQQDEYAGAGFPDVILISLNMLRKNNNNLLKQIKQDVTLPHIPIVILTAFAGEEAILGDDAMGDNLCICKPLNFDCLVAIVKHIGDFSLHIVKGINIPSQYYGLEAITG